MGDEGAGFASRAGVAREWDVGERGNVGLAALAGEVVGIEVEEEARPCGTGNVCLRSMASTMRWKRRKRDSARMSVEGRSIVLESSLTVKIN